MLIKRVFSLCIVFVLGFSLYACNMLGDVVDDTGTVTVTGISIDESALNETYELEDFELQDLLIQVTYSDGSVQEVRVTEAMISAQDFQKLSTLGTHTITVRFANLTTSFTITLTEELQDMFVMLRAIYDMGVSEGEIAESYEEWLESIRGEKGDPGQDGREIELRGVNNQIDWRYKGETQWHKLIELPEAIHGQNGIGISSAYLNTEGELILVLSDETELNVGNIVGEVEMPEIEMEYEDGVFKWRYVGETEWRQELAIEGVQVDTAYINDDGDLILVFNDGSEFNVGSITGDIEIVIPEVEISFEDGVLRWRYEGQETWNELIVIEQKYIVNFVLNSHVMTYVAELPQGTDFDAYYREWLEAIGGVNVDAAVITYYTDLMLMQPYETTIVPAKPITVFVKIEDTHSLFPQPTTHFSGVEDIEILQIQPGETPFDILEGVTAYDDLDGDLTEQIIPVGGFDHTQPGEYQIVYYVYNSRGDMISAVRLITVIGDGSVAYPSGWYSFKYADTNTRHHIFAAMEQHLLDHMYGGIPVFSSVNYVMYSSRLDLPVSEHLPVMGYAPLRGMLLEDDTNVLFMDDSIGNVGEFTYRSTIGTTPETFHHWMYNDIASSDIMTLFLDSLFFFDFNSEGDGFEVRPSMASTMPIAMNQEVLPSGTEVATIWRVPLRTDLVWNFHPNTDTSGFALGHETIDAHDFIATYKLALDEAWVRATMGGTSFLSSPHAILNAEGYVEGEYAFDDVGLRAIDDYTLEFEFENEISEWEVMYWLTSFIMTPIHMELYQANPEDYGTTPETTAYHGPFMLDYSVFDEVVKLVDNPNFHDPDRYTHTGIKFYIISNQDEVLSLFLEGKLDAANVLAHRLEDVVEDPRLKVVPGPTTFRIMINGLGSTEAQQEQFGNDYVPEPILASKAFRRAMYFAIDRETLAYDVMGSVLPQQLLFTDAYLVDAQLGIAYRNTVDGLSVADRFASETYGFDLDMALDYWREALDEMVQNGTYEPGAVIELELRIFTGSDVQQAFGDFIKTSFEELFNAASNEYGISVEVTIEPTVFPGIYFDYMMQGVFDLAIGGISGSTLNASNFMGVFADDNRAGFTLNWGIDTTTANIPIEVINYQTGEVETQMWSFNALERAMVDQVFVINGVEADPNESLHIYTNFSQVYHNVPLGTEITVEGLVTHSFPAGFYLFDGEHHLFVFNRHGFIPDSGDIVQVTAEFFRWQSMTQLSEVSNVEIIASNQPVPIFEPTPITVQGLHDLDHHDPTNYGKSFIVEGTLELRGFFQNVHIVDGEQTVVVYYLSPEDAIKALEAYVGQRVRIEVLYYTKHSTDGLLVIFNQGDEDIVVLEHD